MKQKSNKEVYIKPVLQKLGGLSSLTKGTTAVKFDSSTKGSKFDVAQ